MAGDMALREVVEKLWGNICGARGDGPARAEQRKEKIRKEKEGRRGFPWLRVSPGVRGAICKAAGSWRLWSGGA